METNTLRLYLRFCWYEITTAVCRRIALKLQSKIAIPGISICTHECVRIALDLSNFLAASKCYRIASKLQMKSAISRAALCMHECIRIAPHRRNLLALANYCRIAWKLQSKSAFALSEICMHESSRGSAATALLTHRALLTVRGKVGCKITMREGPVVEGALNIYTIDKMRTYVMLQGAWGPHAMLYCKWI